MAYMFFKFASGMMLFLTVSILSACCVSADLFVFSVYAVVISILQLLHSGIDFLHIAVKVTHLVAYCIAFGHQLGCVCTDEHWRIGTR